MDQVTADLHRRVANLATVGTIAEVDHARALVRVDINGRLSDWLRWPGQVGRHWRAWAPIREGTQVSLQCPSGDPANATISGTLYSDALPPPSDSPDLDVIQWDDGTAVSYDAASQTMTISGAKDVTVLAAETLRAEAKTIRLKAETIEIDGRVVITGDRVEHNGRTIGDDHQHTNVKPGPSLTGPPAG